MSCGESSKYLISSKFIVHSIDKDIATVYSSQRFKLDSSRWNDLFDFMQWHFSIFSREVVIACEMRIHLVRHSPYRLRIR